MTETEEALIAGMREHPYSLGHMAALADYWHETGDPRWEPMTWLVQNGKVGQHDGYWRRVQDGITDSAVIPETWWRAMLNSDPREELYDLVFERLLLCGVWEPRHTTSESP